MRVLVTGDRGYIGAVLVPWFIKHGHDVVGLDAGWYDGCDFGAGPSAAPSRTGDVRDVTPADLEGVDAVVHLAAISNDPIGHLNPEATYSVNAWGAVHVAKAAKIAGVERFLFSSSCSLYGAAGDAPVSEDAEFNLAPEGHKPEFDAWRWVPMDELPNLVVPFKRNVYEQVVAAFRHLGR